MNTSIETNIPGLTMRFAQEKDIPLILRLIKSLASYEQLEDKVQATEELLQKNLFERRCAEVVFAEYAGEAVGYMLFFHNFSTFLGKPGIYLEDIYVAPEMRNKGLGRTLFAFLARLARERDCGRLEWNVLDWNAPSIAFYEKLGAKPLSEWKPYRLAGDALDRLAEEF